MMETTPEKTSPQLFALLVGINNYPNAKPLYGCLRDVVKVEAYLNQSMVKQHFSKINIHIIPETEASKANIVEHFQTFLGQAQKDDVALFYFSGHGTREKTNIPAFKLAESGGRIGGVVCWDTKLSGNKNQSTHTSLSDKELRYLIHHLSQNECEIISIFDCCHSGDNTRDLADDIPPNARQVKRRAIDARAWEGFIFHDEAGLKEKIYQEVDLENLLPQGPHVQIAACHEMELAYEEPDSSGKKMGIFTMTLLELLQKHQGNISYHELYNRIRNRMRQTGRKLQSPQIYLHLPEINDRHRIFLTHQPNTRPTYCSVSYNDLHDQWRIDLGAIHGLSFDPNAPSMVEIFDINLAEIIHEVPVSNVDLDQAILHSTLAKAKLDPNLSYRGRILGLGIQPIQVFLADETLAGQKSKERLEYLSSKSDKQFIELALIEENADYVIRLLNNTYHITEPFDRRPLVKPIRFINDNGQSIIGEKAEILYQDLVQIAEWHFLKNLDRWNYKKKYFNRYPLELIVYQKIEKSDGSKGEKKLNINQGMINIQLKPTTDMEDYTPLPEVRFELINHSEENLWCNLTFLTKSFAIEPNVLSKGVHLLGEREKAKSIGAPYIPIDVKPYIINDNWKGVRGFFKLMVNKKHFDPSDLKREPLPRPYERSAQGTVRGDNNRGSKPNLNWSVGTYEFFYENPSYQKTQ